MLQKIITEKTLKVDDPVVDKKEFHASKQRIALNLIDTDKIVISDKFKQSHNGPKYFIGYLSDNIIRPLCIILLSMNGYIKYFDNGRKNISER